MNLISSTWIQTKAKLPLFSSYFKLSMKDIASLLKNHHFTKPAKSLSKYLPFFPQVSVEVTHSKKLLVAPKLLQKTTSNPNSEL